jgi:hypothetical protein
VLDVIKSLRLELVARGNFATQEIGIKSIAQKRVSLRAVPRLIEAVACVPENYAGK